MCAGGARYFTNAWVAIRLLRQHGCRLPIEVWHLGLQEMTAEMRALLEPLGVRCVDALERRKTWPCRRLGGWELKAYAVVHSTFEQVLFLDSDNMAVADPEYLFDLPEFRETGAIFWPDLGQLKPTQRAWDLLGLQRPAHPEFESGQMLLDRSRCWKALRLALWLNEQSDFFYQFLHGDKETFHLAFRKLNQPFTLVPFPVSSLRGALCQQDLAGRRLFQHRNTDKWTLFGLNTPIDDFWFETDCRRFLAELRDCWDGRVLPQHQAPIRRSACRSGTTLSRVTIQAGMISCPARETLLAGTLERLRQTDWGEESVWVQMDAGSGSDLRARQEQNARILLERFLSGNSDYLLFLEDDLEFNRHLWKNLMNWSWLTSGAITLASLYNPGILEAGYDARNRAYLVAPEHVFGSQALLISRAAAEHSITKWDEIPGMQDIKLSRLVGQLRQPIVYHAPSLVQHVQAQSTWGGPFHQAMDFQPDWLATTQGDGTDPVLADKSNSCKTDATLLV
jgi:hypothetical protein